MVFIGKDHDQKYDECLPVKFPHSVFPYKNKNIIIILLLKKHF